MKTHNFLLKHIFWQIKTKLNDIVQIYFSNEEGKFGDDRAVDYIYMPDRMVEDARNVSINLHGEHGQYVMMQLFFADKWMLISEITFISGESLQILLFYKQILFR